MNDKTSALACYLLEHYPYPDEFSAARLTKMVYLCDWRAAITLGRQITPIQWFFHLYGPYTDDVVSSLEGSPHVKMERIRNSAGNQKRLISKVGPLDYSRLSEIEVEIADHIIEVTKRLNFTDFIELVYSTFPIVAGTRFENLDLPSLAANYLTLERDP